MRLAVALASLIALSACAPTPGEGVQREGPLNARPCLTTDRITNFRTSSDSKLYVKTLNDQVFELQSMGCFDLDGALSIAIVPDFGAANRLCAGDSARVLLPGSSSRGGPCRVRLTRALTPAEVEALPSRDRP